LLTRDEHGRDDRANLVVGVNWFGTPERVNEPRTIQACLAGLGKAVSRRAHLSRLSFGPSGRTSSFCLLGKPIDLTGIAMSCRTGQKWRLKITRQTIAGKPVEKRSEEGKLDRFSVK